ncbi:serine hydrolase domain-containing protein [Methyloceanibacter caenitepidi]|uniref:Beta-lactamase class C and other penicillin binding proteins n=1 Tax=Methyloceanibacter caenitepidi TaxID=1384459 RepID=A0A0A8JZW5_9HYPH|nr:serine hydrolase [Methyloceanibacter caenitepidi]BAQ16120.1 beta-lactamase class C and other penicillin binding proteins [Methyloceanibacter caenitepidi]
MSKTLKRSGKVWLVALAIAIAAVAYLAVPPLYRIALLGSGYMAQQLCAGLFVSGRTFDAVMAEDLSGPGLGPLAPFTAHVDDTAKTVRASPLGVGFAGQTAVFQEGLGCTLVRDQSAAAYAARARDPFDADPPAAPDAEWPQGSRVAAGAWRADFAWPDGVDGPAASQAVDAIFADPDPERPRATRALVVVHKGRIVAERYAPGFDAHMPLVGWSMSKTGTNALIGLRVKDGKLGLDDTRLMPEWLGRDDMRGEITLNTLLRMISGLAFHEDPDDKLSDVSQMMFVQGNTAAFAASKPLAYAPGTHWSYSTGTAAILSGVLRETFDDERDYLRYPRERLFGPLGMRTAQLAPDAAGTFMGGAFLYASARDWARLGLLYLQDGRWDGEQILPEGWVAYTTRPTVQSPNDRYGAQVWLKLEKSANLGEPPMPADSFYMLGHNGQVVAMIPSKDLVVVRLGQTMNGGDWDTARDLGPLVNAFTDKRPDAGGSGE